MTALEACTPGMTPEHRDQLKSDLSGLSEEGRQMMFALMGVLLRHVSPEPNFAIALCGYVALGLKNLGEKWDQMRLDVPEEFMLMQDAFRQDFSEALAASLMDTIRLMATQRPQIIDPTKIVRPQ